MGKLFISLITIILLVTMCMGCASQVSTPTVAPKPPATSLPSAVSPTTAVPTTAATATPPVVSKPIEISYVTFLPRMTPNIQLLNSTLAEVEKWTNGQLIFKYRGGPEAIPPFDQAVAAKTGAIDSAFLPTGYYTGLSAAPVMNSISEISAHQEKETGAYDYMVKLHQNIGLRYITREWGPPGKLFYLVTNKAIEHPQQLAGQRMSGGSFWEAVAPALGMKTVAMEVGDQYQALERGIIDAAGNSIIPLSSMKFQEVVKNIIDTPFLTNTAVLVINLEKWNSIPKNLQDLLITKITEIGPQNEAKSAGLLEGSRKAFSDAGVKPIKFSQEDTSWYLAKLNQAVYDFYAQKAPVEGPELYKLLKKDALKK